MRSRFRIGLLILAMGVGMTAFAQTPDPHLVHDPAQRLYSESPWAHGYLHGYAMGFHCGDLDVQLSHAPQDIKQIRDFKRAKDQYQKGFGDKKSFIDGYEDGFSVGYADAYKGLEFRAVLNLRELSQDLPHVEPQAAPILDTAIMRGYTDGRKSGLADGRVEADYRPDGSDCELSLRFKSAPAPFYCGVYALGYRLGYADGFTNQHPRQAERRIAGEQ